jgi:hypothetical protein
MGIQGRRHLEHAHGTRSIRHVEMVMQKWDSSLTGQQVDNLTTDPFKSSKVEEERIHICNYPDQGGM